MVNVVPLGDIMNHHRKTSYPLTQEWKDLAFFLATRIKNEIEAYFTRYATYEKVIINRKEIEPEGIDYYNKLELLIYAAIKTHNRELLNYYLDQKLVRPGIQIGFSEFLSPTNEGTDEFDFLRRIKELVEVGYFEDIESEISRISQKA